MAEDGEGKEGLEEAGGMLLHHPKQYSRGARMKRRMIRCPEEEPPGSAWSGRNLGSVPARPWSPSLRNGVGVG